MKMDILYTVESCCDSHYTCSHSYLISYYTNISIITDTELPIHTKCLSSCRNAFCSTPTWVLQSYKFKTEVHIRDSQTLGI